MNLFFSIFLSTILAVILFFMKIPGMIIAFGIIAGSLFWGLFLLKDIHQRIVSTIEIPNGIQNDQEAKGDHEKN